MNTKGNNRSVRRTKEKLRAAVSQLLLVKPLKDITVREIAEMVDINRGTFYLHYKDVYDLVEQIENELITGLDEYVSSSSERILLFVQENSDMFSVLLGKHGSLSFQNRMNDILKRSMYRWKGHYADENPAAFEHSYVFLSGGFLSLLVKWLNTDMAEPPKEMAKVIDGLIVKGINHFENTL